MTLLEALITGIIQGLTEFLPVSSSGHVSIAQNIMGLPGGEDVSIVFTLLLHLATLLAVCVVFRRTIAEVIVEFLKMIGLIFRGKFVARHMNQAQKMGIGIILATLPMVLLLPIKDKLEVFYSNLTFIGAALMATSLILFTSDQVSRRISEANLFKRRSEITAGKAIVIGFAQCVSALPGISRSGTTIAAGLFCGLDREYAAKFSFMLSIPVIIGSNIFSIPDAVRMGMDKELLIPFLVGFAAAAVSGFMALKFLQYLMKKDMFVWLSAYCMLVGGGTLFFSLI